MLTLVRRALAHYENKTTDQASEVMPNSIDAYVNETRYKEEVERIFKHQPLALCLISELPEENSYRSMNVIDTPVLITRAKALNIRAF